MVLFIILNQKLPEQILSANSEKKSIHRRIPVCCYHSFTDSRHSFHDNLEVNWRESCSAFLQELPEVSPTCGFFNCIFGQIYPTPVQGNLIPLIAPDEMFCFTFNVRVYLYDFGHYLSWAQILEPQAAFQMGLYHATVCCDCQSDSICPSPGANLRLSNSHTIIVAPP